jgi:hypothetical protein
MLTLNDATKLLQLCPICPDIQNTILIFFLGYGTPSSGVLKKLIEQINTIDIYKSYHDNIKTLWRAKIFLNNDIFLTQNDYTSYEHCELLCDLKIAYLDINKYVYEINYSTENLKRRLYSMSRGRLLEMINNMERFRYGEYGTPTANIIRNAPIKDDDNDSGYDSC